MLTAYFLSHNGMGDNINNIDAIRYLLNGYYDDIYLIYKTCNLFNLQLLYPSTHVHFVTINDSNETEMDEYTRVLPPLYAMDHTDILVSGPSLTPFYQSKITNPKLSTRKKLRCYWIQSGFDFIRKFYEDICLDLSIYYNYFQIDSTSTSKQLYDDAKQYNIIFCTHRAVISRLISILRLIL